MVCQVACISNWQRMLEEQNNRIIPETESEPCQCSKLDKHLRISLQIKSLYQPKNVYMYNNTMLVNHSRNHGSSTICQFQIPNIPSWLTWDFHGVSYLNLLHTIAIWIKLFCFLASNNMFQAFVYNSVRVGNSL